MRRAMVRGFPYHVIFMADEAETLVIAVAHHRQDPAAWTKRTLRPRG